MKAFKKTTAVIIAIVMLFSCVATPVSALSLENGIEIMSTDSFYSFITSVDSVIYRLFGFHLIAQDKVKLEMDEEIVEICEYVNDNAGLNVPLISTEVFSASKPYINNAEKYGIDVAALHTRFLAASQTLNEDGKGFMSAVLYWFAIFSGNLEKISVSFAETEQQDVFELIADFTYSDGTSETVNTSIYYDSVNNMVYGKDGKGVFNLGYDFDIDDLMVYVPINVWMREFGFCSVYDLFSFVTPYFNYKTVRVRFNYDGKDYMIQLWKGRYIISNGAEMGIYTKPESRNTKFYDCAEDEDMLNMSMELYHADELLVKREKTQHWWLCGFGLSQRIYLPSSLTLNGTIEMKDELMLSAFCSALDEISDIEYTVEGLSVSFKW